MNPSLFSYRRTYASVGVFSREGFQEVLQATLKKAEKLGIICL
jgi:hypothetical protein